MLMEKISALVRFECLGVITALPIDEVESGAEEIDRRIRTLMRPWVSVSDCVCSGTSWPSREITSPSTSILVMDAAVSPGNSVLIKRVAALYSNRNNSRVYLNN